MTVNQINLKKLFLKKLQSYLLSEQQKVWDQYLLGIKVGNLSLLNTIWVVTEALASIRFL